MGRASFYRNFGGKEDILRSYIGHIFHEWTDRHDGGEQPVRDQIRTLFAHFEAHRDFYVLLNGRGLVPLLKDAVIGVFDLKAEDPAAVAYAKAFVAYSFYGWIETWFRRGMRESAESWRHFSRQDRRGKDRGSFGRTAGDGGPYIGAAT